GSPRGKPLDTSIARSGHLCFIARNRDNLRRALQGSPRAMQFSWLDVILVVIMLISGFLAMVRGFTREVLSIFSWAVAAVAALYLTTKNYWTSVETYFPSPAIAQVA